MTISSTNRKAGPFIGNGSASVFAFTFRVFSAADLDVVRLTVATGVETLLVLNGDYTVSLNQDQNGNPGGSVTLIGGALASGHNLTINSGVENLQPTDLTNQGGFYPEVITDSLDRATIQVQQLEEELKRALKYPVSDPALGAQLLPVAQRAGKALSFDSLGNPTAIDLNIPSTVTLNGAIEFETFANLKADVSLAYTNVTAGRTIHVRTGDHYYVVLASGESSYHVITNGGVKLNVIPSASGYNVRAFGATGDGSTNDTVAVQAALNAGGTDVIIPAGNYRIAASGLTWPAGVVISGVGTLSRVGTPTAPCLLASAAGTYRISGVSFNDGGHSAQYGCIESTHPNAKLYVQNVFATNGYAGVWAKAAEVVDIDGGEYWACTHNLYFGDILEANLPREIKQVTVRGVVSRNTRAGGGGNGLKTVSNVKRLTVLGGRFYSNDADGIDLFAGCDEAMLVGVDSSENGVNGIDIKIGDLNPSGVFGITYFPYAKFGQRRRVSIIGGFFSKNKFIGIKVYGQPGDGYFQDILIQSVNIIGNAQYGIQCRAVAARILGNLLIGNAVQETLYPPLSGSAPPYSVIYMEGAFSGAKPYGGVIANNVIGNNGRSSATNIGINVYAWDTLLIQGNIIGNTTDREEAAELDWGLAVDAKSRNIRVVDNQFGSLNEYKLSISAAETISGVLQPGPCVMGENSGVSLKTRDKVTIASGTTSATVTHGAAGRPVADRQVKFFPTTVLSGAGYPYRISTSETQFTVGVSPAPSADIDIAWEVDLTGETNTYRILQ